jgi:hypothetical protein
MTRRISHDVPLAVTQFSPDLVTLHSTADSRFSIRLAAMAASFLFVIGIGTSFSSVHTGPVPGWLWIALSLVIYAFVMRMKQDRYSIRIDGVNREIIGIKESPESIAFSRIMGIEVVADAGSGRCGIRFEIGSKQFINLLEGYPDYLAWHLAAHLSFILARPIRGSKPSVPVQLTWLLPWRMPETRFPVEWPVLSAALAGFLLMLIDFGDAAFFAEAICSKWLLLLTSAFTGVFWVSAAQDRQAKWQGDHSMAGMVLLLSVLTIIGLNYPAHVSTGLIPLSITGQLLATFILRKKKSFILVILTLLSIGFTLLFSGQSLMAFHTLRSLDAGVIEQIVLTSTASGPDVEIDSYSINRPEDVRPIVLALKQSTLFKSAKNPKTLFITVTILRPFSSMITFHMQRQGAGAGAVSVIEYRGNFMKFPVCWAAFESVALDHVLTEMQLKVGMWPPRYQI